MADGSSIEWTDATWNPVTGCSVVSPGCTNCYAMRLAGTRLRHHPSRQGLTRDSKAGPVWTGEVRLNEDWLTQPLRWTRPRTIFVCAHGDLFHESVPDAWIDQVFAVMAAGPSHTFQVLTKRSSRMREFLSDPDLPRRVARAWCSVGRNLPSGHSGWSKRCWNAAGAAYTPRVWPLPNVWLGVSAEDQRRADERVPDLLATPAAIRFVSAEPLLGAIDFSPFMWPVHGWWKGPHRSYAEAKAAGAECGLKRQALVWAGATFLDWIVVGGESGPGARPMHPEWARSIRDQCAAAGVAFHFKQWGTWLDERQATLQQCGPGPEMFDVEGRPRGDRWHFYDPEDVIGGAMIRVGKASAGRLLDGIEHNEMPGRHPVARAA